MLKNIKLKLLTARVIMFLYQSLLSNLKSTKVQTGLISRLVLIYICDNIIHLTSATTQPGSIEYELDFGWSTTSNYLHLFLSYELEMMKDYLYCSNCFQRKPPCHIYSPQSFACSQ